MLVRPAYTYITPPFASVISEIIKHDSFYLHFGCATCTITVSGTERTLNFMDIIIDIENSTPLFTQLMDQIKAAIVDDTLLPGAALPSIRQLANDLDLNNKTVAKAYRLLERDSIIQAKGYRGTFIHPNAKANCAVDLNEWVIEKLTETISSFRSSGVTDSEIRIAFGNVMHNRSN